MVKRTGGIRGMVDTEDIVDGAVTAAKVDKTDTYQMEALRITGSSSFGLYTCTATEVAGNAVYLSAADTVAQADATDTTKMPAIGIIVSKPDATSCWVCHHGVVTGLSGLTAGSRYYVSETAGAITTTPPTAGGSVVQIIGVAKSTTELIVMPCLDYSINP